MKVILHPYDGTMVISNLNHAHVEGAVICSKQLVRATDPFDLHMAQLGSQNLLGGGKPVYICLRYIHTIVVSGICVQRGLGASIDLVQEVFRAVLPSHSAHLSCVRYDSYLRIL